MSIVEALDTDGARRITESICVALDSAAGTLSRLAELISEAYSRRADRALGYESWDAYAEAEFAEHTRNLSAPIRRELVASLTADGMSTPAQAPVLGVSQQAINRTQQRIQATTRVVTSGAPVADWTPGVAVNAETGEVTEPGESLPVITEHTVTEKVRTVTGLDGKEYKNAEPRTRKRKPITDAARDAGWELRKAVERIQRIQDDDRFSRNKVEILAALQPHLDFATEVINGL